MSHAVLQRVVVRMLFDPAFARSVYADAENALKPLSLSPHERGLLTQSDPRAYQTDTFRRTRALHGLLEAYPVSAYEFSRRGRPLTDLDGYFSSATFHTMIQSRGSMTESFGRWLREKMAHTATGFGDMVRLEEALVYARTENTSPAGGPCLVLQPGATPLELSQGTLSRYATLHTCLNEGAGVLENLLSGLSTVPKPDPSDASAREAVLVEPTGDGTAAAGVIPSALFHLLEFARQSVSSSVIATHAETLGADAGEGTAVIEQLVTEGLLVPCTGPLAPTEEAF